MGEEVAKLLLMYVIYMYNATFRWQQRQGDGRGGVGGGFAEGDF